LNIQIKNISMKEYTITMNFTVKSTKDYDEMNDFAEQLTEDMMNDEKFIYQYGVEITEINVHNVESDYDEEENMYLENDDE